MAKRIIKIKHRNQKRNKEISDGYSNIKVQVSQVALKVTLLMFKKNMAAANEDLSYSKLRVSCSPFLHKTLK